MKHTESRSEFAIRLLKTHGTVTMGMVADTDQSRVYTFRNAVAEAKDTLKAEGYSVVWTHGKTWRENSYTLNEAVFDGQQRVMTL